MKRKKLISAIMALILLVSMAVTSGCQYNEPVASSGDTTVTDATNTNTLLTYETSDLEFKGETFSYDGKPHSIYVSNYPAGVSVKYINNNKVEPGEYTVIAEFTSGKGYAKIPSLTAKLVIKEVPANIELPKQKYDLSNIDFQANRTFTYDGNTHRISLAGEIPSSLSVNYVYTLNGVVVANPTEVGDYRVQAVFTNTNPLFTTPATKVATMKIVGQVTPPPAPVKTTIDMSGVVFASETFIYDGNEKSLTISNVPSAITSYELLNNSLTEVGSQQVTAVFTVDTDLYYPVANIVKTLTVASAPTPAKLTINMSNVVFNSQEFEFDGTAKSLTISNVPSSITSYELLNNSLTDVGTQIVTARFVVDTDIYNPVDDITRILKVVTPVVENTIYFQNTSNWTTVYAHTWNVSTSVGTTWKDSATIMTDEGNGVWSWEFNPDYDSVVFHNGNSTSPTDYANQTADLSITDGNIYNFETGAWTPYNVVPEPQKETIDMSGITFTDASFDFDNQSHSIEISGTLPNGITDVIYENNAKTEIGTYTVVANFVVDTTIYNTVPAMSAVLTIIDPNEPEPIPTPTPTPVPAGGYYSTNSTGYGEEKTISIDGNLSDWSSSMIIAQGVANDDPRVYRDNSMYEIPVDLYAMYAAYDDDNLYLMLEFTNVQDVVAPADNYPLSQGNLWINNLPFFIGINTGKGTASNGLVDQVSATGVATGVSSTIWDSGITWDMDGGIDRLIAMSTNFSNGPFIYDSQSNGNFSYGSVLRQADTGIIGEYTQGILSDTVYGINGGYGVNNNRAIFDTFDSNTGAWVDFNQQGHNSDALDFSYEIAIPLASLGITKADIKANGIGLSFVATFGLSGMDCMPYDRSMQDNADQADTRSQEFNSFEKSDEDSITSNLARIGR